jgi:TonB-linked SusC/RagA family outer membrane protein
MKRKYIVLLVIGLLFGCNLAGYAQNKTVTGTVNDAQTGNPLPGVNILVVGTSTGAATDRKGHYSLNVPSLQDSLRFSFIGYQTKTVPIDERKAISIQLKPTVIASGNQLVVVGYGTQKKENITSSVSKVNEAELNKGATANAGQLLQGKVPGLVISKTGTNPASSPTIKLRGTSTLEGNASPLVIVDGVEGSLTDVAPQDVESVTVLKGASASAIYGTRASSGVIIIQTKTARKGHPTLEFSSYVSTQQSERKIPVLSASQYRKLVIQNKNLGVGHDYGASTNWAEEVFNEFPVSKVTNLNLSAGDDQTSYVLNLNYQGLEGLMRRSNNHILSGRFHIDHSMFDGKLDIHLNALTRREWRYDGANLDGVLQNIFAYNPTHPIRTKDGKYSKTSDNNSANPVDILETSDGKDLEQRGKLFGDITYSPVKGLSLKAQASRLRVDGHRKYFENKGSIYSLRAGRKGYAFRSANTQVITILNLTGTYKNSWKSNNYKILAGYTWKESDSQNFNASNYDFPTYFIKSNNLGNGTALTEGLAGMGSYEQKSDLLGYFARLNYNYKHKYLLTASFRREASSKFGANHKWGNFPAVSAGWNISNEAFMNNVSAVNNLKIRFGFGITGSEPVNPYESLSLLAFGDKFLYNGQWVSTAQPSSNPNPNLQWEEEKEFDFGLDFSLFNSRLDGSFDVYRRRTSNLLYPFTVPTPPFLYSTILANVGTIQNKGIEVHLTGTPVQSKKAQWKSTINYSTHNNTLLALANQRFSQGKGFFDTGYTGAPIQQSTNRISVGGPIGNFYGYKTIGVTDDGHWLIMGQDGKPKPITENSPDDKRIIGNGIPDFRLSWSNTVNYKNWDLSVLMRGAFGFQILNMRDEYYKIPSHLKKGAGNVIKGALDKVYGKRPLSVNQVANYVSYFVENGTFWKIGRVTLGYNFNVKNISVLQKARIYFSVNNVYTITGYDGFDPSVLNFSGLTPSIDSRVRYPVARKFTLGISFKF